MHYHDSYTIRDTMMSGKTSLVRTNKYLATSNAMKRGASHIHYGIEAQNDLGFSATLREELQIGLALA